MKVTLKPCLSDDTACDPAYDTTIQYDANGDMRNIRNGTTSNIYRVYDSLHRLKEEWTAVPADSPASNVSVTYDYVAENLETLWVYGRHTTYSYDTLGRVSEVEVEGRGHVVVHYDAAGRLWLIEYWSAGVDMGLTQTYHYDVRDRVDQIKVATSATTFLQLDYTSNPGSLITDVEDNANTAGGTKHVDYGYDKDGRLIKAVGPWGSSEADKTVEYGYDSVGNILWKKIDGVTTTYTYGVGSWYRLDSFGSTTFSYNDVGSVTRKGATDYTYDFQQQLVKVVSAGVTQTYGYDGLGRRVRAVTPSGTTYFAYSGGTLVYSAMGASSTTYVYLGSTLLMRLDDGASLRFYHSDLSRNVRLVTYWSNGVQVESKYRYLPFGEKVVLEENGNDPRFKFAGQELDSTGLYHMGARYCDPEIGRFLSRDPSGEGYEYALDNPISFYDPTGHDAWADFLGGVHRFLFAYVSVFGGRSTALWWMPEPGRQSTSGFQSYLIHMPVEHRILVEIVVLIVSVILIAIPGGQAAGIALLNGLLFGLAFGAAGLAIGVASGHEGLQLVEDFLIGFNIGFAVGSTVGAFMAPSPKYVGAGMRGRNLPPEWRLTEQDLEEMRGGERGMIWSRPGPNERVRPYIARDSGWGVVNRAPGVGWSVSSTGRVKALLGLTDEGGTISVFEESVNINAARLGISASQQLQVTLYHEYFHLFRMGVGLPYLGRLEEALATGYGWFRGLPAGV